MVQNVEISFVKKMKRSHAFIGTLLNECLRIVGERVLDFSLKNCVKQLGIVYEALVEYLLESNMREKCLKKVQLGMAWTVLHSRLTAMSNL